MFYISTLETYPGLTQPQHNQTTICLTAQSFILNTSGASHRPQGRCVVKIDDYQSLKKLILYQLFWIKIMNFDQKVEKHFFKLQIEITLMFSWKEACQPNKNNFDRNEVVIVTNRNGNQTNIISKFTLDKIWCFILIHSKVITF